MPGPAPRDPSTLARRHKASTAQVLDASGDDGSWPELPPLRLKIVRETFEDGVMVREADTVPAEYRQATLDWYAARQADPQAAALLRSDRDAIAMAAILVDAIVSGRDQSPGAFKALDSTMSRFAYTLQDRWRMKLSVDRGQSAGLVRPVSRLADRKAERERLKRTAG